MKKIFTLLLIFCLSLSLTACSQSEKDSFKDIMFGDGILDLFRKEKDIDNNIEEDDYINTEEEKSENLESEENEEVSSNELTEEYVEMEDNQESNEDIEEIIDDENNSEIIEIIIDKEYPSSTYIEDFTTNLKRVDNNYEITLPYEYINFFTAEMFDAFEDVCIKNNLILSSNLNDNGSKTIIVKGQNYNNLLSGLPKFFKGRYEAIQDSEGRNNILKIKSEDNPHKGFMLLKEDYIGVYEEFAIEMFASTAEFYDIYTGKKVKDCEVTLEIQSTGQKYIYRIHYV